MNRFLCLAALFCLAACSSGGGGGGGDDTNFTGNDSCSNNGQKAFVLDFMRDWYYWNDRLPANVDIGDFSSPEALLFFLTTFSPADGSGQPIDRFSSIGSAAADAAFLGEGEYEGFGFNSRFVATNDLRLTRVFVSSPAYEAGLRRGQRILELNGRTIAEIQAAEGVGAVFNTTPLAFTIQEVGGNIPPPISIDQGLVTIDPIPLSRIIDAGGGRNVGYIELTQFISTAEPEFATIFADFQAAGVNDVVLDVRYNGGGRVDTLEELADYLGGFVAENLLFLETRFNADRAAANNDSTFFSLLGSSLNLSRLVMIMDSGSASASEAIANGLEPHVEVTYVGSTSNGKPVGQVGFEFCEKIIRPTSFQLFNADGFGDYFDGIAPDCPAADDLDIPIGDNADPNLVAALAYLDTGACPAPATIGAFDKSQFQVEVPQLERRGGPHRVYADAW